MSHFLDDDFKPEYLEIPVSVHSEEYYVRMVIAWFFATALAKQWEEAIKYIENYRLDPWTHNKTIQKARESNRISPKQKEYLKFLKGNRFQFALVLCGNTRSELESINDYCQITRVLSFFPYLQTQSFYLTIVGELLRYLQYLLTDFLY